MIDSLPEVRVPVHVVKTYKNALSNRFIPYPEIEVRTLTLSLGTEFMKSFKTNCVLAIDDDIDYITPDEFEFGYETWRSMPDRIVGWPSRAHYLVNNEWFYDSTWANDASLVLTGAAFYHNYFNYLYTEKSPEMPRDWVDEQMNCEDIFMNYIVTNATRKAPIKITPRKFFKSPTKSISAKTGHITARSECVTLFQKYFPDLKPFTTDFRADPVLYLVSGAEADNLKYGNVGTL